MKITRRRSNWLSLSLVAVTWFLLIGTLDALAAEHAGALNTAPGAASSPRPPASPPVVARISPAIPEGLAVEAAINESSAGLILSDPLPPPSPPLIAHAAWFNLFVEENRVPTLPVPGAAVPQAGSSNYRVSTAPMSPGEKWALFFPKVFISPGTYAGIAWSGLWGELWDDDENKEDTVENYFADAATRAARSLASKVTHGFLEKFFLPTVLKQDPRYHRSGREGFGPRVKYALTRVFITRSDRGNDQFNISYLGGGLSTAWIANVWEREERRDTIDVFRRWGWHCVFGAVGRVMTEFLSGQ